MPAQAPIGGQLISSVGGFLGFLPFQGVLRQPNILPDDNNRALLDVMGWDLTRIQHLDDCTHTGSFGAEGNSVECIGYRAKGRVKWDLRNPPNFITQNGGIFGQDNFDAGYQIWLYIGSGYNYPVDVTPFYYYSPSAKGGFMRTIIDAFNKKKVEFEFEIVGNSPIFALGGTGTATELTQYNNYIAHCVTRNWVW